MLTLFALVISLTSVQSGTLAGYTPTGGYTTAIVVTDFGTGAGIGELLGTSIVLLTPSSTAVAFQ